jgi:hypothetical protein
MTKKRDRMINYGKDKSLRIVWFWDREQSDWFKFSVKKHYKSSKFWKPVRRQITVHVFKWNVLIEMMVSVSKHRKK